jgi:hypothetical protein
VKSSNRKLGQKCPLLTPFFSWKYFFFHKNGHISYPWKASWLIFFQSSFCIHLMWLRSKFCWKKVLKKIQDLGWNKKNNFSRHLGFFEKLFSTKCVPYTPQMNAKRRLIFLNSQSYALKSAVFQPYWKSLSF